MKEEMEKIWHTIVDLILKEREKLEIDKIKEKLREAFIEEFGIEPKTITATEATRLFSKIPTSVLDVLEQFYKDLGVNFDKVIVDVRCSRTLREDHDWKVTTLLSGTIVARKCKDGIQYSITICPEEG